MMNYSFPASQFIRRLLRAVGLTRPIARLIAGKFYEHKFDSAMMKAVRDATVVWDIGANLGLYTKKYAQTIQPGGRVVAIEPSPRASEELSKSFSANPLVEIQRCALSNKEGYLNFDAASTGAGVTDRVVNFETGLKVEVVRADTLTFSRGVAAPDFVKIDVEGHELHVLQGMQRLLKDHPPKHIFCEVHFSQLDRLGLKNGPRDILKMLRKNGYHVRWIDASHIHAFI